MAKDDKLIWIGVGIVVVAMIMMQGTEKKTVGVCGTCLSNANCDSGLQCRYTDTGTICSSDARLCFNTNPSYTTVCASSASQAISCSSGGGSECTTGTTQCGSSGGSATAELCVNGQWEIQDVCAYQCVFGECSGCSNPQAVEGKYSCRSGDVDKCVGDSWVKVDDCQDYSGHSGSCSTEDAVRSSESSAVNDCGVAQTCNTDADTNCNGIVTDSELLSYAQLWLNNQISDSQLLQAASIWLGG